MVENITSDISKESTENPLTAYLGNQESKKPSSEIYKNLANDPILSEAIRRKKPTYREMLIIATTVIASQDRDILRLKNFEGNWNKVTKIIDEPIFSKSDATNSPACSDNITEAEWVQKYLTVRNVAGAALLIITLGTSFFSFINKDYRSLIQNREQQIEDLKEEKGIVVSEKLKLANKNDENNTLIISLKGEISSLEHRVIAAEQKTEIYKDQYESAKKSSAASAASGEQNVQTLHEEITNLTAQIGDFKAELAAEKQKTLSQSMQIKDLQKLLNEQRDLASNNETKITNLDIDLNRAVAAWNDLLTYIYSKDKRGSLNFRTKLLKDKLRTLEEYTHKVQGMKSKLQ